MAFQPWIRFSDITPPSLLHPQNALRCPGSIHSVPVWHDTIPQPVSALAFVGDEYPGMMHGQLFPGEAFEQREEGRQLMDTNTHRLGAPGIQTFIGDFLQTDLEALPRPDTVFIGGHGGHLTEMVQRLYSYLQPSGCIVFNSVSASSKQEFLQAAEHVGLICHEPLHVCLNDYNPIEILKATLPPNN